MFVCVGLRTCVRRLENNLQELDLSFHHQTLLPGIKLSSLSLAVRTSTWWSILSAHIILYIISAHAFSRRPCSQEAWSYACWTSVKKKQKMEHRHAVRILWTLFTWLNTKQKVHIECTGSAKISVAVRLHGCFGIQLLVSVLLCLCLVSQGGRMSLSKFRPTKLQNQVFSETW